MGDLRIGSSLPAAAFAATQFVSAIYLGADKLWPPFIERQVQVPGGMYLNSGGARQAQVPGGRYVDET